jgi:hypothetical protein
VTAGMWLHEGFPLHFSALSTLAVAIKGAKLSFASYLLGIEIVLALR